MKGKPNIKKKKTDSLYTYAHTFFFYFSEYLQMCDYQQEEGFRFPRMKVTGGCKMPNGSWE